MLKRDYLIELGIESILNYLRKSRQDEEMEKRTGEDTLTAQKDLMDRVLAPLEIPYDQRFEIGSGDKIDSRPVFQGVVRDLREKKYQAIAVKEISRMGRGSYTDMGIIYDLIQDHRIFIITPYKIYDPRNPSDLKQIRFELFMSREEFETTKERLNGGKVSKAMSGYWVAGRAPFGYTYNKKTRKLEINEEEAAVVRIVFDYFVNGVPTKDGKRREVSFRALSTHLQKHTMLKTPNAKGDWHPNVVRQLLTYERFIGILRYQTTKRVNGKQVARPKEEHVIVHDAIPPIIDKYIWDKAQDKITESSHKPRTKMEFSACELAGLCVCIKCGRRMVRQYSVQNYKTTSGEISQYHKEFLWCTATGCTFVKYRAIEEDLLYSLRFLQGLDEDLLKDQLNASVIAEEKSSETGFSSSEMRDQIEHKRKVLKDRENFICEKYESGLYTDELFESRMKELRTERERLDLMEKDISDDPTEQREKIDIEVVRANLHSILELYERAEDKTDRNTVLRSVIDHVDVEVLEKGRGRIPAKHRIRIYYKYNLLMPSSFGLMSV
ncbi:recombinase family protein [Paenibacillus sp. FSL R7-0333]|uniref:recombinase family protein n=1 Tax=Paenibacillus sp. FSL R7-0333 TaxID=1926587 RepID=UPI00268D8EA6